jgi:hypothetical protein
MPLPVRPKLYQQSIVNRIGGTATQAPHVGYLDANKSALEIRGTITQQDPTGYYVFSFRKGESFRIATNNNRGVRVQLLDQSGTRVLADNGGTNSSLKEVFAKLKSAEGLKLKNANYVLKVTYDVGVSKSRVLNYDVSLYSGDAYTAKYKTLASADTIQNQLLNGGSLGFSATATAANLLTANQSDTLGSSTTNVFDFFPGSVNFTV